jgi:hypothetical protein
VAASSSAGSWKEDGGSEDGGSECSRGEGVGFSGLLWGLFGCCLAPRGSQSLSEDEEGESCSEEGSEEFEDAWETRSEASRCSSASKQQQWGKQKQGQLAK